MIYIVTDFDSEQIFTLHSFCFIRLGLLLARVRVREKTWWRLALAIPLIVPPYVLAFAWTWMAGSIPLR